MKLIGKFLEQLANTTTINSETICPQLVSKTGRDSVELLDGIDPKKLKSLSKDTFHLDNKPPEADIYYKKTDDPFLLNSENAKTKPFYYIYKLWSMGKGSGTRGLQTAVMDSVRDKDTKGRIFLDAQNMTRKCSPAGFYFKLGFRFKEKGKNKIFQEWLNKGGKKKDAPQDTGLMFLPKENILHCLIYGRTDEETIRTISDLKKYISL